MYAIRDGVFSYVQSDKQGSQAGVFLRLFLVIKCVFPFPSSALWETLGRAPHDLPVKD